MTLENVRAALQERLHLDVSSLEPFGDGHSGFTYATTIDGTRECVLRLSPPGARIAGNVDIGRQGYLMQQLGAKGLPVPGVIAFESAPVLAGRSFMLIERVHASNWRATAAQTSHRHVASAAVESLRLLHTIDPSWAFPGAAPRTGPREELERWGALLARAPETVGPGAEGLLGRLDETAPPASTPAVVHGDFHYGNLLFRNGDVVAILDWEVAVAGERLVDVGSLIVASLRRIYAPEPNSTGDIEISAEEVTELYGATRDEIGWFIALNCLKYAAIISSGLKLHRSGRRVDPEYERLHGTLAGLVSDGDAVLRDGLDADCLQAMVV